MAFGMLVLLVLVVAVIVWITSQRGRLHQPGGPALGISAREALDHRLVSGEITAEQYDEIRGKLVGGEPPSAVPPPGTG
jgi:uncharacterized membrane protein